MHKIFKVPKGASAYVYQNKNIFLSVLSLTLGKLAQMKTSHRNLLTLSPFTANTLSFFSPLNDLSIKISVAGCIRIFLPWTDTAARSRSHRRIFFLQYFKWNPVFCNSVESRKNFLFLWSWLLMRRKKNDQDQA